MIGLSFLIWIALILACVAYRRRLGVGRSVLVLKWFVFLLLLYPAIEIIAVFVAFDLFGRAVAGTTIFRQHSPVDVIALVGGRRACSWDCYGLLEAGYKRVEVQITGQPIPDDFGRERVPYFVQSGLYAFEVAASGDPRCASYLSWVASSRIAQRETAGMDADLLVNGLILDKGACLVAEPELQPLSDVSVARTEVFHDTTLGEVREYRTSVFASGSDNELPMLLAEDRVLQLKPIWPVVQFILSIGDGMIRYEHPPMAISAVVAPLEAQH
ncbi:hypothetical protein [Dongia sp.]|uniref:hypothetical protein n=1 Tax=Dongia sp. TaxID=1977262 RepID=UPI003753B4C8